MKTLKIRNLELGKGIPAICIPNTGKTKEEILALTKKYMELPMDIMEWRVDWFEHVEDTNLVLDTLEEIRNILQDTPLLFTFRTTKEGGVHDMPATKYIELNKTIASSELADLIDVEIFSGDAMVSDVITSAHTSGCYVIASNHDFQKTPDKQDMISRLCKMQAMGADVLKLAVMPQNKQDVLTLLSATEEMVREHAKCPVVTMSMSTIGSISRITGELFGSCITFGAGEVASAPGQMEVKALKEALNMIHTVL